MDNVICSAATGYILARRIVLKRLKFGMNYELGLKIDVWL